MNHVSICSLKKSVINQINSYLSSIGREQFSPDYIKAIKNPVMSEEIQNTLELNFRGFFIDIAIAITQMKRICTRLYLILPLMGVLPMF